MDTTVRRKKGTRRVKPALTATERRRLAQLVVSAGILLLALAGRGLFPAQAEAWQEILLRDADFKGAFARFGEAAANGEPVLDALGELCMEVFTGGEEGEEEKIKSSAVSPVMGQVPALSQRWKIWESGPIPWEE